MVKKSPVKKNTPPATPSSAPVQPPAEADFEEKIYKIKLIKDANMRTMTDITYNETALNLLILQIETLKENYALTRLSLIRNAMNKDLAEATPQTNVSANETKSIQNALNKTHSATQQSTEPVRRQRNDDDIL
jgi:hypothetical protein